MVLELVAAFPLFYLIVEFGILAAIAWIFSLATNNGVITVCTATIRKTCQSKNKLAALYLFCSNYCFNMSICVFYACLITSLSSQNAFSHLDVNLHTFVFNADNLTLTFNFKSFKYFFKGPEKLLQRNLPKYIVLVQFIECMNAAFLLNPCLTLKEGLFNRSRSFYFLMAACAMLLWLISWLVPTSHHYSAPHDIVKIQHSLFQIRYFFFRMLGQDSKFSPDMQIKCYTGSKLGGDFFFANGDFGICEIIISIAISLLRFISRFLVISSHLDIVNRTTVKIDNTSRHGQINHTVNKENPLQIIPEGNPINNELTMRSSTKEDPDFFLYHDVEDEENRINVPNDGDPNSKSEHPSDFSTPKATRNVNNLRSDRTQDIIDPTTYRSGKLASSSTFAKVRSDVGIDSEIANSKAVDPVHVAGDKTEPQQQHYESCDTEQPAGVGNLVTVKGDIEDNKLNTAVLPSPIVDYSSSSIYSDIDGDDLQASALPPNSAPGTHDCSELEYAHDDSFDQDVANYCKNPKNDFRSQTSHDGAYTSYSTVMPEPSTMRNSRNGFPSSRPKQAPPRPPRSEEEMSFPSIEGILVDPALQTLQYGKMNVRVVSARKPDC